MAKRKWVQSAHHKNLVSEFHCAMQAWWIQMEYETRGYATEMAAYKLENPMPRFKDFLIAQKQTPFPN